MRKHVMQSRKHIEILLVMSMVFAILVGVCAVRADGASACNNAALVYRCGFGQIHSQEDVFMNYDLDEKDHSRHRVDWPVDLVFWNLSSLKNIKTILQYTFPSEGDDKWEYVNNGRGWLWDENKGLKTEIVSPIGDAYHFRVYGSPFTSRMFNLRWGYYNIATAHIDHFEGWKEIGSSLQWSGNSEKAENVVAGTWQQSVGGERSVARDWIPMDNYEEPHTEGDHHWRNDGKATKLRVPDLSEVPILIT